MESKTKFLAVFNALAVLFMLTAPFMVNLPGTVNNEVNEISNQSLFAPIGFTFAIWGIIYTQLLIMAVYIVIKAFRTQGDIYVILEKAGILFIFSHILNGFWLILSEFPREPWYLFDMLCLLAVLILIYQRLDKIKESLSNTSYWLIKLPFSIYLGWICVATIGNFTIYLYAIEWTGFGVSPLTWTLSLIVIATSLGLYFLFARKDIAYNWVLVWSLFGIYSKHAGGAYPQIETLTLIMMSVLTIGIIYQFFLKRKKALR